MEKMDLTLLEMKDIIFDIEEWRNSQDDPSVLTLEDFFKALADKVADTIQGVRYQDIVTGTKVGPSIIFPWNDGSEGDYAWSYNFSGYYTYEKTRLLTEGYVDSRYVGNIVNLQTGGYNPAYISQTSKNPTSSGSGYVSFYGNLSTLKKFLIRYWKYKNFYCLGGFTGLSTDSIPSPLQFTHSIMFTKIFDVLDNKEKQCAFLIPQYGGRSYITMVVEDEESTKNAYYPTGTDLNWSARSGILCTMPLVFDGRYYTEKFAICFPDIHASIPINGVPDDNDPWKGSEFAMNGTKYRVNQNGPSYITHGSRPYVSLVARIS